MATKTKTEDTKSPGREASSKTQERLNTILETTKAQPGVTSPEIAKILDISTLTCSQLGDRLVKSGQIVLVKLPSNVRTYYRPGAKELNALKRKGDLEEFVPAGADEGVVAYRLPAEEKPAKEEKPKAAAKTSTKPKAGGTKPKAGGKKKPAAASGDDGGGLL